MFDNHIISSGRTLRMHREEVREKSVREKSVREKSVRAVHLSCAKKERSWFLQRIDFTT